jgi:DNA polymerase (family X)
LDREREKPMNNKQVASVLNQLADMMEVNGDNPFKVNAYRRAARAVENSRASLTELDGGPEALSGIGKGTASVIKEILETGSCTPLEELRQKLPEGLPELLQIPGMGPKTVHAVYHHLGVTDLEALEQALKEKRLRSLSGFGPKKEEKILEGIRRYRERPDRMLLGHVLPVAEEILKRLREHPAVEQAEMAGSLRRMKETVKDLDFVVATRHPEKVADAIVSMPEVTQVINHGDTKVSVMFHQGFEIQVDIRLVSPEQFVAALVHFTGSKEHNVRLRQRAKEFGWKVSEYGIYDVERDEVFTFADEKEVYQKLQLPYVIPEMREDRGELDVEEEHPERIRLEDYRGDLHMHTRWSDGAHSVREMALAAKERGYEYIAITDHSQYLKVANGLTADELRRQREEIARVNEEVDGITVLAGIEMDILPGGELDFPDEVLAELDLVIASIHSAFQQDQETMTKRILQAMENPHVHIIAHPTGRLINRRDPYAVDLYRIFQAAQETGTVLELNANPHRLDLNDYWLKLAREEYGVDFTINTDAHSTEGMDVISLGIATARRGWLEADHVINTYSLDRLLARLKS